MATTPLRRTPPSEWQMAPGEFASPNGPAPGASNWGAGAQPARSVVTPAPRGRNLGTMTSADLNRSPTGFALNQRPQLTGAAFAPQTGGYAEYSPQPAAPAVAATGPTGYRAPQQTERANPLSGDNNVPMESSTSVVSRAPFSSRGARLPSGQDAVPAPIRTTETIDDDIGQSMQGTFDRLRGSAAGQPVMGGTGLYRRSFTNPASADRFTEFTKRLFA